MTSSIAFARYVAVGVVGLAACKERPGPPSPTVPIADSRTLDRLKKEQDPYGGLTAVATGTAPQRGGPLKLPPSGTVAEVGGLRVEVVSATARQTLGTAGLALSTEDFFLEVRLRATNAGQTARTVRFADVSLSSATQRWTLVPDAQRVAGTRPLELSLPAQGASPDVVLLFEVPPTSLDAPLVLTLPSVAGPGGGELALAIH